MRWLVGAVLVALVVALEAHAAAPASWPPASGEGDLFVHYGEEHWNDIDGTAVLTRVVEDTIRFKPALVTMSGDKVNDGTTEQLQEWLRIMGAYDTAGIPYMAAVGNHDGKQPTPDRRCRCASWPRPVPSCSVCAEACDRCAEVAAVSAS